MNNTTKLKGKDVTIKNGTIVKYTGSATDIEIPSNIGFKKVFGIANKAFADCQLTSVILADGITTIKSDAFRNNAIVMLQLPEGLTEIGRYAFSQNDIGELHLPDSIQKIGMGAFSNNQISKLQLPDSLESISSSAFSYNAITTLHLPDSLTAIYSHAFSNNQIKALRLSNSITHIQTYAFESNCIEDLVIPPSIRLIEEHAFANNRIKSLSIPNTDVVIYQNAFVGNMLNEISLPENAKVYGRDTFFITETDELSYSKDVDKTMKSMALKEIISDYCKHLTPHYNQEKTRELFGIIMKSENLIVCKDIYDGIGKFTDDDRIKTCSQIRICFLSDEPNINKFLYMYAVNGDEHDNLGLILFITDPNRNEKHPPRAHFFNLDPFNPPQNKPYNNGYLGFIINDEAFNEKMRNLKLELML